MSNAGSENTSLVKRPGYHSDFSDVIEGPDKEITLLSADGVKFSVNAIILRASSGFFNTALSLPQPEASNDIIVCPGEDSTAIEGILRIITGKECPSLSTVNELAPIALAAEKWDMAGVLSIIKKLLLRDLTYASTTPLDLYWLGCRLKWDDVLKLASKYTCDKDVYSGATLHPALSRLDPVDLWRLTWFHRVRRSTMESRTMAGLSTFVCLCDYDHSHETERYLNWILKVVESRPASRPPTKHALEQKLESIVKSVGGHCSITHLPHAPISEFIINEWASLPQTV